MPIFLIEWRYKDRTNPLGLEDISARTIESAMRTFHRKYGHDKEIIGVYKKVR